MQITTMMTDELVKYLDMSALELKLTAQNMANVDTPGYKAMGFDFANEMRRALGDMEKGQSGMTGTGIQIGQLDGLVSRPDGNNVSIDRESLTMAEAQLQFRMGVELLNNEFMMVRNAIRPIRARSRIRDSRFARIADGIWIN